MDAILFGLGQIDAASQPSGGADANGSPTDEVAAVRPVDWTRWPQLRRGRLPGWDALMERAVAQWSAETAGWLGCPVVVRADMAVERADLGVNLGADLGVAPSNSDQRGPAVARHLVWWAADGRRQALATLAVEASVLEAVVERHYGAAPTATALQEGVATDGAQPKLGAVAAPSAAVQRVLERWGRGLVHALLQACPPGLSLPPWQVAASAQAWPTEDALPAGPWLTVRMQVDVGGVCGELHWASPWVHLEPASALWRSGLASPSQAVASWAPRLQRLLQGIELPLQARAPVGNMGMQQMANWGVGDVLPLDGHVLLAADGVRTVRATSRTPEPPLTPVGLVQMRLEGPANEVHARVVQPMKRPASAPVAEGGAP
jgi:hypothetical protein